MGKPRNATVRAPIPAERRPALTAAKVGMWEEGSPLFEQYYYDLENELPCGKRLGGKLWAWVREGGA